MKVFYAGSFDPFTYGHARVIEGALRKYDVVYVGIGINPDKECMFSFDTRRIFIEEYFPEDVKNGRLIVEPYEGLSVDKAISVGADVLIRGIRSADDLIKEECLAEANRTIARVRGKKIETIYVHVEDEFLRTVSSSVVKKLCDEGEFIATMRYVPPYVHSALMAIYLKEIFFSLFKNSINASKTSKDKIFEMWDYLLTNYQNRKYHNLSHIAYMLNMLAIYKDKVVFKNDLILAIFFHDVRMITNAEPSINEWHSADVLGDFLAHISEYNGLHSYKAKDFIMATSHIDDFLNDEVAIIADLDMAIMAAPYPKIWRWYEEGIRKEYSDASEQEYVKARKEFLLSVLDKPRIFHTQFFYDLFEEKARYNIKKQIKKYTDLE